MRRLPITPLNRTRSIATAFALLSVGASGSVSIADTRHTVTGFYLDVSPGRFVEYLSLNESSHQVVGYFEAIDASTAANDRQARTQIFTTRKGSALTFGTYTAAPNGDGFVLMWMSREGEIVQRHFLRASVETINAAIVALDKSVIRSRMTAGASAKKAEPNRGEALSVDNASQLRRAEENLEAAQAELRAARDVADRVCASARKARMDANTAIEQPGATLTENQSRMAAMNAAGLAEQNEAAAEHRLAVAATALGTAQAEVAYLRSHEMGDLDRGQVSVK